MCVCTYMHPGRSYEYECSSCHVSLSLHGQVPGSCTPITGGTGIPNSDLHVFVYAENVGSCATAGSSVLAFASSCQTDQNDRPTFGLINFCPGKLPATIDSGYPGLLGVAIHEYMHVLGALPCSFATVGGVIYLVRGWCTASAPPRHRTE